MEEEEEREGGALYNSWVGDRSRTYEPEPRIFYVGDGKKIGFRTKWTNEQSVTSVLVPLHLHPPRLLNSLRPSFCSKLVQLQPGCPSSSLSPASPPLSSAAPLNVRRR